MSWQSTKPQELEPSEVSVEPVDAVDPVEAVADVDVVEAVLVPPLVVLPEVAVAVGFGEVSPSVVSLPPEHPSAADEATASAMAKAESRSCGTLA